jgi:hypothetical protein
VTRFTFDRFQFWQAIHWEGCSTFLFPPFTAPPLSAGLFLCAPAEQADWPADAVGEKRRPIRVAGLNGAKADSALGGQAIAEVGLAKNRFHFRAGAKCVPPNSAAKAAAVVGLVKYQRR